MGNFMKSPEPATEIDSIEAATTNLKRIRKSHDTTGKRLTKVEANLGTEIVHSRREIPLDLPTLLDVDGPSAVASVAIASTAELTGEAVLPYTLGPHDASKTVHVRFAPTVPGESRTHVSFVARFDDGYVEQQLIPVIATARDLRAPTNLGDAVLPAPKKGTVKDLDSPASLNAVTELMQVNNAVGGLFVTQREAIDDIGNEQKVHKPPAESPPFWADLVGFAFEVGLTVIGGELGHQAGKLIGKALTNVAKGTVEKIVRHAEKAVEGAVDAAGSHLKVEEHHGPNDSASSSRQAVEDFFAEQRTLSDRAGRRAQNAAVHALAAVIQESGDQSAAVTAAMGSFEVDGLDRLVREKQKTATAAQFMKFAARAEEGAVTADTSKGKLTTTVMSDIREEKVSGGADRKLRRREGVLEIFAEPGEKGPKVSRVRCCGVADIIAEQIPSMDLREVRVPIVIRYKGTTITVDEGGRIRSGRLTFQADEFDREKYARGRKMASPLERQDSTEIDDAHDVNAFAEAILSQSLRAHGVQKVETDATV